MVDSKNLMVKICCISSIAEADLAIENGADVLGLVSEMPSGPGVIAESLISEIIEYVDGRVQTFLLTSKVKSSAILKQYNAMKPSGIQLVDSLEVIELSNLKKSLPNTDLIQVLHVLDENNVNEAIAISPYVDAILLDSGDPHKQVKELGGTGRTHNWEISKRIIKELDLPVFLAGGLNSSNVQKAIESTDPYGVDLCSGVRTDGKLDAEKLKTFIKKAKTIGF